MSISVVIPARNAESLLGECVRAVRAQTVPAREVLVVVAEADDATLVAAERLRDPQLRVLRNPAGDRGSALNIALEKACGDLIAMVDAQALLADNYLEAAERALADPAIGVVGGPMVPRGRGAIGQAMAAALRSPFGVGDSQFHFSGKARDVESVYLGVYRRELFTDVGLYNVALRRTEDDDLNARVRAKGYRIRLDPTIRSVYRCRETLRAIWDQYFGYGYWKVALAAVRPEAMRPRHFAPAAFVIGLSAATALGALGWWAPTLVLSGCWILLALLAALAAPAESTLARLYFPAVALTMHVGYGAGSIAGVLSLGRLRTAARRGATRAETSR